MSYFTQMVSRAAVLAPQLWSVSPRLSHLPLAPALLWGKGQHRGMAGHSKWANIRHTKALKDDQKQKTTTKIIQMIKIAIKEGGSTDPKLNSRLSNVIDLARTQSIPLTSINNIIKTAQKSQDNAKSMLVEYRAPGGVLMLVEVLTDNLIKTKSSLQSIIKKTMLQEAKGTVQHVFEEKGVVVAAAGKGAKVPTLEEALDLAIEVGAEEVEEEEEGTGRFVFTSSPDAFFDVKKGVEGRGYTVSYANVDFIPNVTVTMTDEEVRKLDVIIEKLEAVDEVMRVHVNL
ncbi:probable transcriptional regulatory protein DR_2548 [Eriocheir sinensis]|uniref:probable transcriptional regulatory protein DR_2548 n=1 Tax=Eriocheir sinensis TaxID=95602 RepID=UPI0021C8E49E|nr:probable transcriptional regulatory protein DR_2548 [Eriocheir sinensis]